VNQPVGGIAAPVFGLVADTIGIGSAFSWLAMLFIAFSVLAVIATATGAARIRATSSA
jgi:hypothetical protein